MYQEILTINCHSSFTNLHNLYYNAQCKYYIN